MRAELLSNELSRTVKLALDSGEAATLEEARDTFARYRLRINVGADVASSPTLQAALLTIVNTGRRCFLGGVEVTGALGSKLLVPWGRSETLADAVCDLQGRLTDNPAGDVPQLVIGDASRTAIESEFALRVTFDGWRGGVVPLADGQRLNEQREFTPAGVMAGALAVAEAFQFIRRSNAQAGRRAVGLSLWRPESDWLAVPSDEPKLEWLPSRLWLIGLGHLGQAYLWTLGFLPYKKPEDVLLVLQDFDELVAANDSTSPLTNQQLVGRKKTRALADWCEQRGFRTCIQERRFAANFHVSDDEPRIALCGVDNEEARAALEDVGFARVIEAGLGRGTEEYLAFQVHTFPGSRSARQYWGGGNASKTASALVQHPAYQSLAADGLDQCGLTLLANRAVGACFVGAFTSALVIAELLRTAMLAHRYEVLDGSLRALDRSAIFVNETVVSPFNLGVTEALENGVDLVV